MTDADAYDDALAILEGSNAKPMSEYSETEQITIRAVAARIKHGTPSAYSHHKCRCDVCKTENRNDQRRRRQSRLTGPTATPKAVYNRAVERLIDLHVDEFRRLVDAEADR